MSETEVEKYRRGNNVLRDLLSRMVRHIESEAANGDGIAAEAWDDYHAARMLIGQACKMPAGEWDSEAAGRAIISLLGS